MEGGAKKTPNTSEKAREETPLIFVFDACTKCIKQSAISSWLGNCACTTNLYDMHLAVHGAHTPLHVYDILKCLLLNRLKGVRERGYSSLRIAGPATALSQKCDIQGKKNTYRTVSNATLADATLVF